METVSFIEMKHGTQQDYVLLDSYEQVHAASVADRLLSALWQPSSALCGSQDTGSPAIRSTAWRIPFSQPPAPKQMVQTVIGSLQPFAMTLVTISLQ